MKSDVDNAIESLRIELQNIGVRQVELKKTINQLLALNGFPPEFSDVEASTNIVGQYKPKGRDFVGKNMLDSAKEFLRKTGRASTAQEILDGLIAGDFQFPAWKPKLRLKNLAIFLGSNKEFVQFDTQDGKAYGLAERYPERVRERDNEKKSATQDAIDAVKEKTEKGE